MIDLKSILNELNEIENKRNSLIEELRDLIIDDIMVKKESEEKIKQLVGDNLIYKRDLFDRLDFFLSHLSDITFCDTNVYLKSEEDEDDTIIIEFKSVNEKENYKIRNVFNGYGSYVIFDLNTENFEAELFNFLCILEDKLLLIFENDDNEIKFIIFNNIASIEENLKNYIFNF